MEIGGISFTLREAYDVLWPLGLIIASITLYGVFAFSVATYSSCRPTFRRFSTTAGVRIHGTR